MFEHLVITLHLLSDDALLDYIRASHYDVAIVDLIQNECMLALPVSMGVPVVGFWMTLPIGIVHTSEFLRLIQEYSVQHLNISTITFTKVSQWSFLHSHQIHHTSHITCLDSLKRWTSCSAFRTFSSKLVTQSAARSTSTVRVLGETQKKRPLKERAVAVNDRVIEEYLPGIPSSAEMVANISGCLVNSHSIYEVPMPRVPTFVNILGVICML